MKKIKMNSLILVMAIISIVLISGCGKNYNYIKEELNGQTFYYNGGSDNSLNGLIFKDNKVTIKNVYYDGNGKHEGTENQYEYTINNETITISNSEKTTIKYEKDDDSIKLDDGKTYFNEKDIKEQLKGYWNSTESGYVLGMITKGQYNVYIEDNKITYESASLAYNTSNDYYYYGPYSGEYKLNFGGFETSMKNGNTFFFNIIDNKVVLLHYNHVCTESDGLLGERWYSF